MTPRTCALLAIVGVLVAPYQSAAQKLPSADYMTDRRCASLNNTFDCARALERDIIATSEGLRRAGDTLSIRLRGGNAIRLVDRQLRFANAQQIDEASLSYFGRVAGTRFLLLHLQFGEGNAYAVLHEGSGRLSYIEGWPVASPDGRWLAVSEDGYFNRVGVFILGIKEDQVLDAWRIEPEDWLPGELRWVDSQTVRVEKRVGLAVHPDSTRVTGSFTVRLVRDSWQASPP